MMSKEEKGQCQYYKSQQLRKATNTKYCFYGKLSQKFSQTVKHFHY